ncbi:hypothetical protein EFQ99_08485 [Rhizobium vallis]|uniref:Uncharacterized protein n=1 Tax=Rhizobium vallis TaxID=634290 RepID=A0A432PQT0_9HYPH|nr:hypothetical protein EFQ99_08485 [Rhizobium vallis]
MNAGTAWEDGQGTGRNSRRVLCAPSMSTVLQARSPSKPFALVISTHPARYWRTCENGSPHRYQPRRIRGYVSRAGAVCPRCPPTKGRLPKAAQGFNGCARKKGPVRKARKKKKET